ncbi:hypothetical protein ACLMJK_000047 [Lecanora helva]
MPSTKETRRRHSKKPSTSKKTAGPPSVISTVSSSSASSNATVTSRSIFPSSLRPSKRPDAAPSTPERPPLRHARSQSAGNTYEKPLNVFAFMEEEEDEEYQQGTNKEKDESDDHEEPASSSSSSSAARLMDRPQPSPRYSDLEVRNIHDGEQRAWVRESLHSDSGISDMRSSSPDQDSPILQKKLPTLPDEPWAEADRQDDPYSYDGPYGIQDSPDLSQARDSVHNHKHWPSLERDHGQNPEPYYVPPPAQLADVASNYIPELYQRPNDQLVRGVSQELTARSKISKKGYELLASKIDSRGDAVLRPIYRKFEMLNNRMLLYLQDEICEMEDQLQELDRAIAHEESHFPSKRASRRAEAKMPSQLQWHRLDLMGRCFSKVEQYNRALTSYSNLIKTLDPASQSSITAYRAWIDEHSPIDETESAFLHKDRDLLSISPQQSYTSTITSNSPISRAGTALETPIVLVAFAFLSTVFVFKFVPHILGRLVISALVGVTLMCTLTPEAMANLRSVRDWGKVVATHLNCTMRPTPRLRFLFTTTHLKPPHQIAPSPHIRHSSTTPTPDPSSSNPTHPTLLTTTHIPAPHTGHITLLTLNNPSTRNALSTALLSQLRSSLEAIARESHAEQSRYKQWVERGRRSDELYSYGSDGAGGDGGQTKEVGLGRGTRVVIISSALDTAFCAGADLKERSRMSPTQTLTFLSSLRHTLTLLSTLPRIPTLTAIAGPALGGGFELALASDIRFATPSALFGLPEVKLGIVPGAGGLRRLRGLVGTSRALEVGVSGRRIGGREARELGIVQGLVDGEGEGGGGAGGGEGKEGEGDRERVLAAAIQWAKSVCEGGPGSVGAVVDAVRDGSEGAEERAYEGVLGMGDRVEALRAFGEKRGAVFKGR